MNPLYSLGSKDVVPGNQKFFKERKIAKGNHHHIRILATSIAEVRGYYNLKPHGFWSAYSIFLTLVERKGIAWEITL